MEKTYEVINGRIYGWLSGLDAMRQAIEKMLMTERFGYLIYTDNYGFELMDLIGVNINYAKADIERRIKECLQVDDRIIEVTDFKISQTQSDSLLATFNVTTIYGQIGILKEVNLNG